MKKTINSLTDALVYQLQGLFYTESKVKKEFKDCSMMITSQEVNTKLQAYVDSGDSKLLKLERIFNHLSQEPLAKKNKVINELISETHHMLTYGTSPQLKDILAVACIQNINAYKISCYKTAYLLAAELEFETVSDLLHQIMEWEQGTSAELSSLSIEVFNAFNRIASNI